VEGTIVFHPTLHEYLTSEWWLYIPKERPTTVVSPHQNRYKRPTISSYGMIAGTCLLGEGYALTAYKITFIRNQEPIPTNYFTKNFSQIPARRFSISTTQLFRMYAGQLTSALAHLSWLKKVYSYQTHHQIFSARLYPSSASSCLTGPHHSTL